MKTSAEREEKKAIHSSLRPAVVTTVWLFRFFAAGVVVVVLSGCAAFGPSGDGPASTASGTTSGTLAEEALAPLESGDPTELPDEALACEREMEEFQPPDGTLSYGEQTLAGSVGSYCWIIPDGGCGACVDAAFPMPVSGEILRVPAGATLIFDYGGESADSIRVGAYPVDEGGNIDYPYGKLELLQVEGRGEASIPFELPTGEYYVDVFVQVPEGDVTYYFRVVVG